MSAGKSIYMASGVSPTLTESGLEKLHCISRKKDILFTIVQLKLMGGS